MINIKIISCILFSGILFSFLFNACSSDATSNSTSTNYSGSLFSLKKSGSTGLTFENTLNQTGELNVLRYNYYLNGAGVAVGDFNNDGLQDLYFTGNEVADKLYLNKGNLKFEDISESSKILTDKNAKQKTWSSGVTTVDINNDGWLDIYVSKSGPFKGKTEKQNFLFVNNGDLTFTEQAGKYGIDDPGFSTQATFFDYDKDGDLDLYVLNHSYLFSVTNQNFDKMSMDKNFVEDVSGNMYKNNKGIYSKVTAEAGLLHHAFGLGVVASDYNNDSWVDLYATSDYDTPDYLFKNKRGGKFENVINRATNHISYYGMGVDIADINNDGHPEISVMDMTPPDQLRSKTLMASMNPKKFYDMTENRGYQYQYMMNTLQLNHGNDNFSEIAQIAGVHKTDWSWSTLLADFDNDGLKDMFITNGYMNDVMDNDFNNALKAKKKELNGKFTNQQREEWLSKLPTQKLKNFIYKNEGDLHFKNTTEDWGLNELTFSNGAAYSDLDNDGDLDIIINNLNDPVFLYENHQSQKGNNYLQIQLKGIKKNPMGLNAKVYIYAGGERQYQELTLTRGYQSAVDNILHFGLGQNTKVDSIVVIWLDNSKQRMTDVTANQKLVIDRSQAKDKHWYPKSKGIYFAENTAQINLSHKHQENIYDDFAKEILLPHKNSQYGPFIATADINGDKLDDFFIGGAANSSGILYLQNQDGTFKSAPNQPWQVDQAAEDLGCLFFDFDQDGDQDLYVVSGGNEFNPNSNNLQDRLYANQGNGKFSKSNHALPSMITSGSTVLTSDFNGDGQPDLFVGGRMKPANYPIPSKSHILIQQNGKFLDKTEEYAPELSNIGLITDAIVEDIDGDGIDDLIVVGEWMSIRIFKNTKSNLVDITPDNISAETGWWNSIAKGDFDNDGDMDFAVGNLGLNYKYNASQAAPFHIYSGDFDNSGNLDIVLSYEDKKTGIAYPVRGRECSSQQIPSITEKFPTYRSFAMATVDDIYGEALQNAYHLQATNFATCIMMNNGSGQFELKKLPAEAQVSSTNAFIIEDFDGDKKLDILLAGNLFASEVETPRNDAGVGLLLLGKGDGTFDPQSVETSGFFSNKDTKDLQLINNAKLGKSILVANNNDKLQIFSVLK